MKEDLQAYIESGILEMYLQGTLSAAEHAEVDRMARLHPEIQAEIEAIQDALRAFAPLATGPKPPEWSAIREAVMSAPAPESPVVKLAAPAQVLLPRWVWAVAAMLVLSLSANLWLGYRLQRQSDQVASLQNQALYMQAQYQAAFEAPQNLPDPTFVLNGDGFLPAEVTGDQARIMVYWHEDSRRLFLHIHQLPTPPADRQYQLWALINGVMVNAGVFEHNTQMQELRRVDKRAEGFVITLEPRGGVPTPSAESVKARGSLTNA
ncbi:MAG: anti-sigma factor [Bacteroidia bacterium]|nr:anti-sigma factor [Bacteroidia bacterium]